MSAVNKSIQLGSNVEYEVMPELSHFQGCAYINPLRRMLAKALN
jgi:hypothetical protein